MSSLTRLPVILFGYDSSAFTNKVRLALRLKKIPFTYVPVPSMLPRPILVATFGLTYRKIPVVAIGRDVYCDTSLIIEALEHNFPAKDGWGSVYPPCEGLMGWNYRGMARGFASFWIDRPFFRTTTGLIPPSVWRSSFGQDRGQLIGHPLDPEKLGRKVPANLSTLDLHLSLLEPGFRSSTWALPTHEPSLADIALYYQLKWGIDIAEGKGVYNLTGGGVQEGGEGGAKTVFNERRFPGLWNWFQRFESHVSSLPYLETTVTSEQMDWREALEDSPVRLESDILVPAAVESNSTLDESRGLIKGRAVSVVPDDTGKDNPTLGELVALGVEEVVIKPKEKGKVDVRIHFPRIGFKVEAI